MALSLGGIEIVRPSNDSSRDFIRGGSGLCHARYARKNDKPVVAFENELSGVSLKHGYE
jgi:hypothetical protein